MEKIKFFTIWLFFHCLALLPLKVARFFGEIIGRIYYKIWKKRVHIARINVDICFNTLSITEREAIVKESMMSAGKWFFEMGIIWMWSEKKLLAVTKLVNEELFHQALSRQHGVVLVIPHLGNWEVMGAVVSQYEQFACFYKITKKPSILDQFILQRRSNRGTLMAPSNTKGIRRLYKHLKAGKVVGILPDHSPKESMGVFAPFFEQPVLTGTLVSSLARKNNASVLSATVLRTEKGFEVHFDEVGDQHNDDPLVAATAINQSIEQSIRLAPEQYQWVYPRFKRCQPGSNSPYK